MENLSIGYGALLTALGVVGFLATGSRHRTALIPSGVGALAIGLGLGSRRERYRRAFDGGGTALSLLGLAGAARGLRQLPALLQGSSVERPAAVIAQSLMAGLSAARLAVGLRELVAERA